MTPYLFPINLIREKLMRLECHFTWDLKKENYDLPFMEIRLHKTISTPHGRGVLIEGRALNHLAYVKFLRGLTHEAVEYLKRAEEENERNPLKCVVTYGN
uniref:Uncharacterized protein n=1 Tax=Anguilla anguilla TaxID=7936 RepID=A0A0E9WI08_ANGAN